ncbi:TRAP transporter large permease [Roseomonas sp. HF4]|uniref:TRAP transporter large permease n=1 Tax=Roseomonas sp. HF4 TaxID=2562313 RepID=UPI0010C10640|nr:TRAP transporter large permease [Roseomonas sp. HF4]
MSLTVMAVFIVAALLGAPLAWALGFGAVAGVLASGFDLNVLPSRMMNAVNAFPLMSIPFFVLAGELMMRAGIMERIISLANACVGQVRGGLAHVTVLAGMGLSTVSGAAVADASALGATMQKPLEQHYGRGFSAAVIAASANLGPIIPPSGAMIVYAFMAGSSVSVGGLFLAGVVPGLMLVAIMLVMCSVMARRLGLGPTGQAFAWGAVLAEIRRSFIVLMMPVIVIGGIVGGAFTATEGSAVAVVYALAVGFLVTRQLTWHGLVEAIGATVVTTAVVGAMIAFASAVTYMLTIDLFPQQLATWLKGITQDPLVFTLMVALVLVVVGCFLESNAAYIMLVPLLHPIALEYGIDPLHFGFLFVLNLVIGMLTPPVGVVLFVVCGIARIGVGEISRHIWPFVAAMYALLLVCMLVPEIVLFLPRLAGY